MKKGRPSKYDPKFCEAVVKYMKQGYSKETVAAKLGISRDTLYEWAKSYGDFSDSIKRGEMESYFFWEKAGIDGMRGRIKGFNPAVWIFVMKNRFRWRDQVQPEVEDEAENKEKLVTHESLSKIARKYGKELEILDKVNGNAN